MAKTTMVLVGGEKDGEPYEGIDPADVPKVFYAVPYADEHKIKEAKGKDAKLEMRDRLAVLAYKYDPEATTPDRFVMVRTPALDKVAHT